MFNECYSVLPHNCVLTIPRVRAEESEFQVPSRQLEGGGDLPVTKGQLI